MTSGRCIAQAEGHPLPLVQSQFARESGFLSLSFFRRGTCQKAEPKSNVVKNLASPSLDRLSSIRGIGYASLIVTSVSSNRKSQQNLSCPPFFSRHYYPASPRRFRGFYHVVFKQHFYFRSATLPIYVASFALAPSLWGTAPSSSSISCSTKLQQPMSALCFENTSAFRFRRSRNFPHLFSLLNVHISGKTGLSDSSSYDEGRSGNFEQLDKPSSVSDFMENNL